MIKHEEKYCPRCKTEFECKVGSIQLCQCSDIKLENKELEYIRGLYENCLCARCMKELKTEFHNQNYQSKLKDILGVFYRSPKIEK
ncbi:cysteine-rich CWC family protein [Salegentibacter sp. JZCK2]|uniref:cysteine-rich CWC family protein n=1 Tax=Salegentibacter tibetensis TaxID=2873600 RepID=UPI001CCF5723|nr:cysteine-rich CWC family protein [Salegentibacter tibetensis]MBZ9729900.1 cysteine-rich CWC family protein [Salegentibacter tibetensis]